MLGPLPLGLGNGPMARQMITKVDLIARVRHEDTASSGVMNLVVAVLLLIGIDYETCHLRALEWAEHAG